MTELDDKIADLWWAGIRLWYNEQDFLQAMQVWDEAIEECSVEEEAATVLPKETTSSSALSMVAPLLMFLAGCYLDAGETQRARRLCRQCLSTAAFEQSLLSQKDDSLALHALSEYAATFQEDNAISEPWKVAYQIAEWAIEKQKQQQSAFDGGGRLSQIIWTDPFQRPGFFYPGLASQAVIPREEHPDWCRTIEEHYPIIRDEYQKLLQRRGYHSSPNKEEMPHHWPQVGAGDHRDGAGQHDASVVQEAGDWRELVLFGSGARPDLAPKTCRLLEKLAPAAVDLAQEGAGEIIFSVLAPHTHIAPHCASTNLRWTAHLGLQIPSKDECFIQVAKEKLCWKEGQMIVFDDSYQHEVHNRTNEIRAVLLLRFWHPNLPAQSRQQALQYVFHLKDTDRQRRCNPPLPKNGTRNPQGMNRQMCATCGRSGFETIRLVQPSGEGGVFVCLCGREVPHQS